MTKSKLLLLCVFLTSCGQDSSTTTELNSAEHGSGGQIHRNDGATVQVGDSDNRASGGDDPIEAAWTPRRTAVLSSPPAGYTGIPNGDASCGFDPTTTPESWFLPDCRFFEEIDELVAGLIVDVKPIHEPRVPPAGMDERMCETWSAALRLTVEVESATSRELEGQTIEVWLGREFIHSMGCDSYVSDGLPENFLLTCGSDVPLFGGTRPIIGIRQGDLEHPWYGAGRTGLIYSAGAGEPLYSIPGECDESWPSDIIDWASLLDARDACPPLPGYRELMDQDHERMTTGAAHAFNPRCGGSLGERAVTCASHADCDGEQRCLASGVCGTPEEARVSCIDDDVCLPGEHCAPELHRCFEGLGEREPDAGRQ